MLQITEFKSVIDLLQKFPTEQDCINHLEAIMWGGNVVSPFDSTSKVYRCKGNKYRCKNTSKYFNVRTGTIFEDTKLPLQKWFIAIYLIANHKKGVSSHQIARDLDVTQKTAWFVLHRIRYAFGHEAFKTALGSGGNTVEVDETFVGGKNKNRHGDKKVENSQGRSVKDKTPILGMMERNGEVRAQKVVDTKGSTIHPVVVANVAQGATVMTDEWWGYSQLHRSFNHGKINHGVGEYVNGSIHTNTIEGFWSLFKRSITGIYHYVSAEHIQNYVDESVFRYNTREMSTTDRMTATIAKAAGKRLTYKNLIAHE